MLNEWGKMNLVNEVLIRQTIDIHWDQSMVFLSQMKKNLWRLDIPWFTFLKSWIRWIFLILWLLSTNRYSCSLFKESVIGNIQLLEWLHGNTIRMREFVINIVTSSMVLNIHSNLFMDVSFKDWNSKLFFYSFCIEFKEK